MALLIPIQPSEHRQDAQEYREATRACFLTSNRLLLDKFLQNFEFNEFR